MAKRFAIMAAALAGRDMPLTFTEVGLKNASFIEQSLSKSPRRIWKMDRAGSPTLPNRHCASTWRIQGYLGSRTSVEAMSRQY